MAKNDNNEVQDLVSIHLVESGSDGTEYTKAEVDEYGEIDWPSDFFDEGAKEALRTLEAAFKKSKNT